MWALALGRLRGVYLGWWVVAGAMGLQASQAALLSNVFGVYVVALTREFGWSTAAVASGFALIQLQGGLLGPLQGLVLDRFGPRRVIAVGVVVFGAGLAALATVGSLTGFYAALLVVGLGASLTGYLSVTTAIVPWFLRRRATAMAWMALGASAGGLLVPLVAGAVVAFGWRPTVLASGLVMLLVGLPSAALMRREPGRYGLTVDGGFRGLPDAARGAIAVPEGDPEHDFTLRAALRTRSFWMLGLGHASALLVVSAVIVHLVPHLSSGVGMSLTGAASVVAALTVVTAVGQALGGVLGDRVPKRRLAMGAMFAHAGGLLALAWLPAVVGIGVFLLLHGLAWGVRGPLMGAMRADYFGATHFGVIMGASTLVFMPGQLLGPITAGLMADAFGDYRWGFTLLAVLAALGSLAFRLATPPLPRQRPGATARATAADTPEAGHRGPSGSLRRRPGTQTRVRATARLPGDQGGPPMPTITVDGRSVEVEHGSKLVLAIEALGIDIGHRCGGKARCTTCRVEFAAGEPESFTRAEYRKLQDAALLGEARLSCQVLVEHDMTVKVLKTRQSEGWADTGPAVALALTPDPQRFTRDELAAEAPLV